MGPTFSLIREWAVPFSLFETKAESYSNLCEAPVVRDKGTCTELLSWMEEEQYLTNL